MSAWTVRLLASLFSEYLPVLFNEQWLISQKIPSKRAGVTAARPHPNFTDFRLLSCFSQSKFAKELFVK